ncbi:MAG: hypothetical protein OEW04_03880 [Nitrospirota bacterium]|nr:hypothetical protein [Nitrospirota bacterium]
MHEDPLALQKTDKEAGFSIDDSTKKMMYEYRTLSANTWVIRVGDMLRDYISNVAKYSFRVLQEDASNKIPLHIHFRVDSYKFEDCRATVDMTISVSRGDVLVLNKKYVAQGKAAHQSTHLAFNAIFHEFMSDFIQKVND